MIYRYIILCVALLISTLPFSATADTKRDIETLSKVVGFINGGPVGAVDMGVIFDPDNPASVEHANEIMNIASGGIGSKVKLIPQKISMASVGNTLSPVLFLTRGSEKSYKTALIKAKNNNGITVSTDTSCLGNGCVLVVKTLPRVDIFVSTAAADQVGAKFASAFSMMITKR